MQYRQRPILHQWPNQRQLWRLRLNVDLPILPRNGNSKKLIRVLPLALLTQSPSKKGASPFSWLDLFNSDGVGNDHAVGPDMDAPGSKGRQVYLGLFPPGGSHRVSRFADMPKIDVHPILEPRPPHGKDWLPEAR